MDVDNVSAFIQLNIAGWSSLVARRAHNPKVVGSNPAPATISLEVSNVDTSSFLVLLWFSKDVQNGFILNFTLSLWHRS